MEREEDWATAITARIGRRVEHFRTSSRPDGKKLTVQALADRCSSLGLPLDRSVLAKLEKGLRQTITVGEVLVLAKALEVPPLLLIIPVGDAELWEVFPGYEVPPWSAAQWLAGEAPLPGRVPIRGEDEWMTSVSDLEVWRRSALPLTTYRDHARLVEEVRFSQQNLAWIRSKTAEPGRKSLAESDRAIENAEQQRLTSYEESLIALRTVMDEHGILPPPLPRDLAYLAQRKGEEVDGGTTEETEA